MTNWKRIYTDSGNGLALIMQQAITWTIDNHVCEATCCQQGPFLLTWINFNPSMDK